MQLSNASCFHNFDKISENQLITETKLTKDTFFNQQIKIYQKKDGYRYSIDSIILAKAVHAKPGDRILDLGTGVAVMPIIIEHIHSDTEIHGIELQEDLYHLAVKNVKTNQMNESIHIHKLNLKNLNPTLNGIGHFNWVISNPPYHAINAGRKNPESEKALARHEVEVSLEELIRTAARMLKAKGRLVMTYPTERLVDLITLLRLNQIEPKKIRIIYSNSNTGSKRLVIEAIKNGKPGLTLESPFIIYQADNTYTKEALALFQAK